MNDLYIKDTSGNFIPIKFDMIDVHSLEDKLVTVTVGDDREPATSDSMEQVHKMIVGSDLIKNAMRKAKNASIMTLPHVVKIEFTTKKELDSKTICIMVDTKEKIEGLPEIQKQLKNFSGRDVVILPTPLSLKEYREIKAIKERVQVRKQRNGGGLNLSQK